MKRKNMLIDLHAHSSGISKCCRASIEEVIDVTKKVKIDGLVLTNHYQKDYVTDNDYYSFAQKYINEYELAKECEENEGIRVFFGIEVTLEKYPFVHILIYGVNPSFLKNNYMLFDYTQEQLYKIVKENNGIMIQAHPFRKNINRLLDLKYLDGIEISCHPLYEGTHFSELFEIAKQNNLILTCGGDYHADTHRPRCGVYFPDNLKSIQDIKEYLVNSKQINLCVQEVDAHECYDTILNK